MPAPSRKAHHVRGRHYHHDRFPGRVSITIALFSAVAAMLASVAVVRAAGIDDGAHLFSPAALAQAAGQIEQIRQDTGRDVEVVTVTTLGNQSIQAVAPGYLAAHPTVDVLIYISRTDRSLALEVAPSARRNLSPPEQAAIRDLILRQFDQGNFDLGLVAGVQRIGQDLRASPSGPSGLLGVGDEQLIFLVSGLIVLVAFLSLMPTNTSGSDHNARWSVRSLRERLRLPTMAGDNNAPPGPGEDSAAPATAEPAGQTQQTGR
jgi:uncharacterized membrane protein YgcG